MFTKYIVFTLNLIIYILTIGIINKIFKLYNKKWLTIPTIILYGLSIGCITTVIFLRMYMLLTLFCLAYLYWNLKLFKNNFEFQKYDKIKLVLIVALGFLTQYYFCIYIIGIFLLTTIYLIYNKKIKELWKYISTHILSAIAGIIFYPMSIYHMFFSYRSGKQEDISIVGRFKDYLEMILHGFSIENIFSIVLILAIISGSLVIIINKFRNRKNKENKENKKLNEIVKSKIIKKEKIKKLFICMLLIIPIIIYIIAICIQSPNMSGNDEIRYVLPIFPIISILCILVLNKLLEIINIKEKNRIIIISVITIIISINGLIINKPNYLYTGYSNNIEIAKQYKDIAHIYLYDNYFTHLSEMQTFLTYNKTLIVNVNDKLDKIQNLEGINTDNQYAVSIVKWIDNTYYLEKMLEHTNCSNYKVIDNENKESNTNIYLIYK